MKNRMFLLLTMVLLASVPAWPRPAAAEPPPPESPAAPVVRAYLASPRWEDRLQFVLRPDDVKPFLQARYAPGWKEPKYKVRIAGETPGPGPDWILVEAEIVDQSNTYYVLKTPQGWKIDWENSVGFNRTSPEAVRATKPAGDVRFRALACLDDYEDGKFKYPQEFTLNIHLADAEGNIIGQAYIEKKSPDGRRLFDLLQDSEVHAVALDLKYVPYPQRENTFLVSKLVRSDSWFYEPGK